MTSAASGDQGPLGPGQTNMGRVRIDGKFFALGDDRLLLRGVTYGTFEPRSDGARFGSTDVVERDLSNMASASFNLVRTYTSPPEDLLESAQRNELHVLAGVYYPDWRYLVGNSRRQLRRIAREAGSEVRREARRLAGDERVAALCLGNEVPADVIRWLPDGVVSDTIHELVDVVKDEDPAHLVTYANYPTAEYLPLEALDFLMFNVFLENKHDFRRYLTRLHHLAGDRPLMLGEVGLDAGSGPDGEERQAEVIDWQLETSIDRGVAGTCVFAWTDEWWVGDAEVDGWYFGLTRADRSPRPALDVVKNWNTRTVRDLDFDWPSVSVVVCAYNAEATLDECLRHTCALDYPELEIIVVDDGSTDSTAEIARRHDRCRLVAIEHAGLSVARNEGFRAASGDLIAYLDSDAYPSSEWLYYLALGLDTHTVAGVGGPNVPPPDDPFGAHVVARSPGGPVHVLLSDSRAEHIPGCNMAFWKQYLEEVGGFDPIYQSAGDDVDLCWKVLDRGWEIGFHPAASVWHHRRPGLRAYLRQQRGYGRSEALVEARHPDRFTPVGSARWRGRIYDSFAPSISRARIYRGLYGAAAYQSVYQGGGHELDLAHQLGVPVAVALILTAPLALLSTWLALPACLAVLALVVLALVDMVRARPPREVGGRSMAFRASVAMHHLLQPLVRTWGRTWHRRPALRDLPESQPLPGPARNVGRGIVMFPEDRPRAELTAAVIDDLRRLGVRTVTGQGWEDHDADLGVSALVVGQLQSSSHPEGSVQVRVRPRLRWHRVALALVLTAVAALIMPVLGWIVGVAASLDVGRGLLRCRTLVARTARANPS